jgi:hypothetical protein
MEAKSLGALEQQLPEIGFGTWNYTGGTEPIRAAVEHGAYRPSPMEPRTSPLRQFRVGVQKSFSLRLSGTVYGLLATKIRYRSRSRIESAGRQYVRNALQLFGKM